jgi:hypothetical protein
MRCQHLLVSMPLVSVGLQFKTVFRFGIIRKLVCHLAPIVLLAANLLGTQAAQN